MMAGIGIAKLVVAVSPSQIYAYGKTKTRITKNALAPTFQQVTHCNLKVVLIFISKNWL